MHKLLAYGEAQLRARGPVLLKLHYDVHDSQPPVAVSHHHAHQQTSSCESKQ